MEMTLEQQRALAIASARLRAQEQEAQQAPAQETMGLRDFQSNRGGAAFGNPILRAKVPRGEMTDIPYEIGGNVTDVLAKTGMPAEVAAAGGYLTNVGMNAIPALMGGGGGRMAAPVGEGAAKYLMQSAVKPTIADLRTGKAARAIDTLLKEGVNPTNKGMEVLRDKIGVLGDDVAQAIADSTAKVKIDPIKLKIDETKARFLKQVDPHADMKAIDDVWDGFKNHPLIKGKTIPVQLAQEIKQGLYKILEKKYGQLGSAEVEASKGVGRGLREAISEAVPEVSPLNAKQMEMINALKVAERRALLDGNKNPLGLTMLANDPVKMLTHWANGNAAVKGTVARLLYNGRNEIPEAIGATAGAAPATLADLNR